MVGAESALPGRSNQVAVAERHAVLGNPLRPPFPVGLERAIFGLGCFWGAERIFWQMPGVFTTAVGYAGGYTQNPTYQEVCSSRTGHAEVVLVVFDPDTTSYEKLLAAYFEGHDPTQYMRQGNDVGTQYRSVILTTTEGQRARAEAACSRYDDRVRAAGFFPVVTEIAPAGEFFYAEDYHQQYLAKDPGGYCGLGGTGVLLGVQD